MYFTFFYIFAVDEQSPLMLHLKNEERMNPEKPGTEGANIFKRVFLFYRDGFRSMTVGRTLWAIIAVKLVVFFLILRWLFFPNFLSLQADDDEGKATYVREQITKR